ncbi:carbohydrate ABC transporter permease [Actinopolymorpha pittospori]|uniref:ABC-type sugar transport system permease subunit n=1 Tax=Actinopolymorpha pittospori TaxID=648752 RepID=A0A927N5S4_9ACTN|nr:sugar ABC transporter permease [Actinopolymorpha pittospori]MBE1613191.1 ABC-type sugar transport system permease subunit [Actinopolymorpha pittospori]
MPEGRRRFPWYVYLALLPLFVTLAMFAYYPAVSGIWHSFYEWRPGFDSPFVGLDNYVTMLADDLWWRSFRNLGFIFVFGVTIAWAIPLLAAELVISLESKRAQFVFRTLLIAPMAFPGVVTVLLWAAMYEPNNGVINRVLKGVGLGGLAQNWVGDPHFALLSLLFIGFPFVAGLPFLVFLTTLQNVSSEVFEAAALDGCGRLRRLTAIDLPLMASQLKLLVFLATISVLQYGFAAYLLTGGGPDNATQVPVLRMLGVAFQGSDWGYAAALSTTLFVMTILLSIVIVYVRRKDTTDVRSL